MADIPNQSEVVVIGAGPAGSTAAALLAKEGREVLVIERERFPRFRIGESLMPETYWTFERLGVLDRLRSSDCPVKASVQFISESGRPSRPFYFFERNPHPCSYTWQVERAWLDQMLADNAASHGAEVRMGCSAREVIFEGSRAVGVKIESEGDLREVRARVIVDATGQSSLIARRLGLQRRDPRLQKGAVFAHYENGRRDPGIDEGATLVIHTAGNRGWFWWIPLSRNRVSVGVVSAARDLFQDGSAPEAVLEREIRGCPAVASRLAEARRVSPVRVLSDFSYRSTRCAGDGWTIIGDAFGFLDPIYSSGVLLAFRSAEMAAECIGEGLRGGDLSAAQLGKFGPDLARGIETIRNLVYAFYTPGFSFANFIREHPEHRDRIVQILIGAVFQEGIGGLFQDMKQFCDLPDPVPLDAGPEIAPRGR